MASSHAGDGDRYKMESTTTYDVMNEWIKKHEVWDMKSNAPPAVIDRNLVAVNQLNSQYGHKADDHSIPKRRVCGSIYPTKPKKLHRNPKSLLHVHQGRMGANWHNITDVLCHTGSHQMSIDAFGPSHFDPFKKSSYYLAPRQVRPTIGGFISAAQKENYENEVPKYDEFNLQYMPPYPGGDVEIHGKYLKTVLPRVHHVRGRVGGNWEHVKEVLCHDGSRLVFMGMPSTEEDSLKKIKTRTNWAPTPCPNTNGANRNSLQEVKTHHIPNTYTSRGYINPKVLGCPNLPNLELGR